MSAIRERAIAGIEEGETFSITRTFSEEDAQHFAAITRDYNPVHFEKPFYEVKGYKKPICHGLLVGSMLSEIGGQIGWLATAMDFHFRRPVYFGDTITCELTLTEVDRGRRARAKVSYFNQNGAVVLQATLEGILPSDEEREVLRALPGGKGPYSQAAAD